MQRCPGHSQQTLHFDVSERFTACVCDTERTSVICQKESSLSVGPPIHSSILETHFVLHLGSQAPAGAYIAAVIGRRHILWTHIKTVCSHTPLRSVWSTWFQIHLTCMFLDCARKSENLERNHTVTWRTNANATRKDPMPGMKLTIFSLQGDSANHHVE